MTHAAWAATALVAFGVGYLALASFVWANRKGPGSQQLIIMLVAVKFWSLCYALELTSDSVSSVMIWSGLKYLGILALPPALWSFVLNYTGRGPMPRKILALMMIEPLLVLTALAVPDLRHLIQDYEYRPLILVLGVSPYPQEGQLFWAHATYQYVLMLGAVFTLGLRLARIAAPYRRQAFALIGASLLPFVGNVVWIILLDPELAMTLPDPTPFLFGVTAVVLVWGFFRLQLLDVAPVARGHVIEQMADGVLVLDVYGRIVDANPAAGRLLGSTRAALVGRVAREVLPTVGPLIDAHRPGGSGHEAEVVIRQAQGDARPRTVAVTLTGVTDSGGHETAHLVMLYDVTEQRRTEQQLRELLEEQTQLAETLQQGLRPSELPTLPGLALAARSVPATRGGVSGDFYDVHPAGPGRSALVLGDVSGKGVQAAVVTSMARYTVRTLSAQGLPPREVLEHLNEALLAAEDLERFCTVAYGHVQLLRAEDLPTGAAARPGAVRLTLALGGHPPPLLRRRDRSVHPVGIPGTALGLVSAVDVREVRIDLEPGDVLLAYTDGVTEARNGDEQFGEDRLARALAAVGTGSGEPVPVTLAPGASVQTALRTAAAQPIPPPTPPHGVSPAAQVPGARVPGDGPPGPAAAESPRPAPSRAAEERARTLADEVADGVLNAVQAFATSRDDVALLVLAVP